MEGDISLKTKLSNGNVFYNVGLGTFYCDNYDDIIESAIKAGYNLIDTAYIYQNEKQIGSSLQKVYSKGIAKRQDIFITTKYFNSIHLSPTQSVEQSLSDLQTDYVDLLLVHWPMGNLEEGEQEIKQRPLHQIWGEMEGLVEKGLVKQLGLSNFNVQLIIDLLSYCKIPPVINQIECHVYNQQETLIKFLHAYNILPQAWNPIAKGNYPKKQYLSQNLEALKFDSLNEPIIKELASKYKKSSAQIMLRFLLQNGVAIVPKTQTVGRLSENIDLFSFELEKEDIMKIRTLNKNLRFIDPKYYQTGGKFTPIFD